MPGRRSLLSLALAATAGLPMQASRASGEQARTWPVKPGESLAGAVAAAQDGDTIELAAGVHRGQAAVIRQRRLRLRGSGGPVWLQADGAHAEGKALLVVRDGDIVIEGLGFRGTRVPHGNGAGIRFERGRLLVRDCAFVDNQMGLLAGNEGDAELHIEDSRFADAPPVPPGHGLTHLLYIGRIARASVLRCRFSAGGHGHLLKSRAAENLVVGNRLGEVGDGGSPSYELEFPNGGRAELHDNLLVQAEASPNRTMLAFGAEGDGVREGGPPRPHELVLVGNRFLSFGPRPGTAVQLHPGRLASAVRIDARDNRYAGPLGIATPFDDTTRGNLVVPVDSLLR